MKFVRGILMLTSVMSCIKIKVQAVPDAER